MATDPPDATHPGAQQVPPWWTDPTENVKDNLAAERRYQDALRILADQHTRYIAELRAQHQKELRDNEQEHAREMRKAETERINAILAENAAAVQRAAEVQAAQQQALAAQVTASAETARTLQTATAATVAETLRTTVAPMQARIEELSRAQYETQGQKQQVVETRDVSTANKLSANVIVGIVLASVTVLGLLITLATLYAAKK